MGKIDVNHRRTGRLIRSIEQWPISTCTRKVISADALHGVFVFVVVVAAAAAVAVAR